MFAVAGLVRKSGVVVGSVYGHTAEGWGEANAEVLHLAGSECGSSGRAVRPGRGLQHPG